MAFWAAPAGAAIAVGVFVVIVALRSPVPDHRPGSAGDATFTFPSPAWGTASIHVSSGWSFADSWATNVAAVGGALGSAVGASGGLGGLVAASGQGVFTTMSLLFGGAAALAPLVFAAFACKPEVAEAADLTDQVLGSVGGLYGAASASLFGLVGELCLSAVIAWGSDGSLPEQVLISLALAVAAFVVAVYAARTLHALATFDPAAGAAKARAEPGRGLVALTRPRSLLNGRRVFSGTI